VDIISQLKHEVSERAGSPAGFFRLIQLLMKEVERIDVRSPHAPAQYVALLRAYVLVKRQLAFFNRRCENTEIDKDIHRNTLQQLQSTIKMKRDEAREYAMASISPDKIQEIKQLVGRNIGAVIRNDAMNTAVYLAEWDRKIWSETRANLRDAG
jgi:hypothetical protein